jgi:hypothetical protein
MKVRARGRLVLVLAAAALAAAGTSAGAPAHSAAQTLPALRTTALSQHGVRLLAQIPWHERRYTVGGEEVRVSLSPAYAADPQAGQRWADFFAALPHNSELGLLDAYIAPLHEIAEICGAEALGCYRSNHLVTMGETNWGVSAQSVATHEYGHHIAANRSNAPWLAVDWGTKRWASQMDICSRVAQGMVFPGDEGDNYFLNPGEGFAESYRVLVETHGTAVGYDWPLVDESFRPTPESLAAIQEDVVHPWLGPTATKINGKFPRHRRSWTTQIATPLDGDLHLRLSVPGGGADDVTLLTGDGQTMLARGSWTTSGAKSVEYRICGARSLKVRVTRGGAATRFTLRVERP